MHRKWKRRPTLHGKLKCRSKRLKTAFKTISARNKGLRQLFCRFSLFFLVIRCWNLIFDTSKLIFRWKILHLVFFNGFACFSTPKSLKVIFYKSFVLKRAKQCPHRRACCVFRCGDDLRRFVAFDFFLNGRREGVVIFKKYFWLS